MSDMYRQGELSALRSSRAPLRLALLSGVVAAAILALNSLVADAAGSPGSPVSFNNDVLPVLTKSGCNSGACHGALAGKGGLKLSLRGFDPEADHFAMTRQALGRRIDGADPAASLLLRKPTGQVKHGGGVKLEAGSDGYAMLRRWIAAGAPGPRSDEPKLTSLEVEPKSKSVKTGEAIHVSVRALYSDKSIRDVTRWARFASTDENVATVDADGQTTIKGAGEAAITVGFGGKVALASFTSAFPNPVPPDSAFIVRNFIDEKVNAKLRELRLTPSPPCTDREFVRRVHLDVAGTLPSPETVRAFLADASAEKRAKLIDALLASPEHVDYWAYKLGDLFLVSSKSLSQPAVWSYQQFLRRHVAADTPWDRLARAVVTAQGSNLENGAVNYFLLHKDTASLAEATSVTFLGMSLACAKCHNHPLEKWTQDEYWSYANLFSRVSLQAGDRGGEVIVKSVRQGEAFHLRRGLAMPPCPPGGPPIPADAERREAFAAWLTAKENPWFAKAIVNRVWRHYLGRGLIEAEDDVRETNPPSNPELLAALEADFVSNGFSLKRLMRQILNSAAYQRSSRPLPENAADDRFYSRYFTRRLPGEVILDAYSQVTQTPTPFGEVFKDGGPAGIADYPLGVKAVQLPDTRVISRFLDSFGRPERESACACERGQDATVGQALHLANGQTLNAKLRDAKSLVQKWVEEKLSDEAAAVRLYELALCRPPTAEERKRLTTALAEAAHAGQPRREQLEDLFWAVLTSREFLFNK